MEKKKTEDLLDDFFDEIENESYTDYHKTKKQSKSNDTSTNDFEEKVKTTIESAINSDGFKNVANLINDGVLSFKKTVLENDTPIFEFDVNEMETRLDYVKKELNNVKFDVFHRGQYKEGYGAALIFFVHQMEVSKYNLVDVEKEVKRAIKKKRYKEIKRSDRYYEGYANGLKFLKETLYSSRVYMMNKIKEDLYKGSRYGA